MEDKGFLWRAGINKNLPPNTSLKWNRSHSVWEWNSRSTMSRREGSCRRNLVPYLGKLAQRKDIQRSIYYNRLHVNQHVNGFLRAWKPVYISWRFFTKAHFISHEKMFISHETSPYTSVLSHEKLFTSHETWCRNVFYNIVCYTNISWEAIYISHETLWQRFLLIFFPLNVVLRQSYSYQLSIVLLIR